MSIGTSSQGCFVPASVLFFFWTHDSEWWTVCILQCLPRPPKRTSSRESHGLLNSWWVLLLCLTRAVATLKPISLLARWPLVIIVMRWLSLHWWFSIWCFLCYRSSSTKHCWCKTPLTLRQLWCYHVLIFHSVCLERNNSSRLKFVRSCSS